VLLNLAAAGLTAGPSDHQFGVADADLRGDTEFVARFVERLPEVDVFDQAETERIAVGRGRLSPRPARKCRAGRSSSGNVGGPCDTNRAGRVTDMD